jgi:hypothetical protein
MYFSLLLVAWSTYINPKSDKIILFKNATDVYITVEFPVYILTVPFSVCKKRLDKMRGSEVSISVVKCSWVKCGEV